MQPFDLSSGNAQYLEQLYEQYQLDPSALDAQWVVFFKGVLITMIFIKIF